MTDALSTEPADQAVAGLSPALMEYAERLLLGTGLDVADALRIASGQLDPPAALRGLASALRAGWQASDDPS